MAWAAPDTGLYEAAAPGGGPARPHPARGTSSQKIQADPNGMRTMNGAKASRHSNELIGDTSNRVLRTVVRPLDAD